MSGLVQEQAWSGLVYGADRIQYKLKEEPHTLFEEDQLKASKQASKSSNVQLRYHSNVPEVFSPVSVTHIVDC